MKLDITKNTSRNMAFGIILQAAQALERFIIRTVIIYYLGIEYAGVNGLFSSVMQILNLAELNVSEAIVISMYKPVANGDRNVVNGLLDLYHRYYVRIGFAILGMGFCILPFVDGLVSGTVPADMNLRIVFLLRLVATASSYLLFGYQTSLLTVHQRNDISSKLNLITSGLEFTLQLVAIIIFRSLYYYLAASLIVQIVNNLLIHVVVLRTYPQYRKKNTLNSSYKRQVATLTKDAFISKIGGVIVNSADTIIISATMGLTILGQYQNYYMIMKMVYSIPSLFLSSLSAGLGNRFVYSDPREKLALFKKMTFLLLWVAGFCIPCFLCLFQPFIELWMGAEYVLDYGIVILISIYFLMLIIMTLGGYFEYAAGCFHQDRYRPLLEGIANLIMNIVMVHYIGLYGILLSTILSMLCLSYPWLLYNLFHNVFHHKVRKYLIRLLKNLFQILIICFLCVFVCSFFPSKGIAALFSRGVICTVLSNGILYLFFRNTDECRWMVGMIKKLLPF